MDLAFRRQCSEHHCLQIGPRSLRRSLCCWLSCPTESGTAERAEERKKVGVTIARSFLPMLLFRIPTGQVFDPY